MTNPKSTASRCTCAIHNESELNLPLLALAHTRWPGEPWKAPD